MTDVVDELYPGGLSRDLDADNLSEGSARELYQRQSQIISRFRELAGTRITELRSRVDNLRREAKPIVVPEPPPPPPELAEPQLLPIPPRPSLCAFNRNPIARYDVRPRPVVIVPKRPRFRI
jgi:hypothetical protein